MALLSAANVPEPEKQFKARGTSRRLQTQDGKTPNAEGVVGGRGH